MNKVDCFNLGYVAKLHSYKGEVSLFFDATNPEDYATLDAVYIDLDGILTPFFVERIDMKDKGFAKVKFEGVDSENDAKLILKKELFLRSEEHTSELQSRPHLVCRLLLEKKKKINN